MRRAAGYKRENVCLGKKNKQNILLKSESSSVQISLFLLSCLSVNTLALLHNSKLLLALIGYYKLEIEEAY